MRESSAQSFQYDADLKEYTMRPAENGYEEFTYNAAGQLTRYVFAYNMDQGPVNYLYTYDKNGNCTLIDGDIHWEFGYEKPKKTVGGFKDVFDTDYYAEAVLWAVNHDPQVTNGTGNGAFSPAANCTRGQMVTFLWRAAGCPAPARESNPFRDVKPSDFYYQAVLWAAEQGITTGTSKTTFSPNATVNRAQAVTFLWRMAGTPAAGGKNPFQDVKSAQYYTDAVLWAAKTGVTTGTTKTTFKPDDPCVRGQIVTFLYRYDQM